MSPITCFKAYDVRGHVGDELTTEMAYRIGRAFAHYLSARRVVVGGDARLSSKALKDALMRGLMASGTHVIDLGMVGTEEVYFATFHLGVDGGVEVTGSHNPIGCNGMKFVGRGALPISQDSGLRDIQRMSEDGNFALPKTRGTLTKRSLVGEYVSHILGHVRLSHKTPLRLLVNAGNGAAGHVIDALELRFKGQGVPIEFIKVHHAPDGTFPHGVPNPLLPENRAVTAEAVRSHGAHMGIAWDGDFDRCFLFDEYGEFIEGYYVVGLLAEAFLKKSPGEKIVHDTRLVWNTQDIVQEAGGVAVQSKAGHAFMKERMRAENAVFGGEMSAHYYFRDFAYCDSGMIPWLLVVDMMGATGLSLSELIGHRKKVYPCSGEVNYRVRNVQESMDKVRKHFLSSRHREDDVQKFDTIDGLSLEFRNWRYNLRPSNTESLLRLNIESRGDERLVQGRLRAIDSLLVEDMPC